MSRPPSNCVESLAAVLRPLTGGHADDIVGCEWWVHSKVASRNLGNAHGHQLHFDTEEGLLYAPSREVVHPAVRPSHSPCNPMFILPPHCPVAAHVPHTIRSSPPPTFRTPRGDPSHNVHVLRSQVSTVLYLSGAEVAGPTVVLDQRYGASEARMATVAPSAHVAHPRASTVLVFPGDRLHGVCPSVTSVTTKPRGRRTESSACCGPPADSLLSAASLPRRVTLMIGFYTRDVNHELPRRTLYTACSPMPRPTRACTWPSHIANDAVSDAAEAVDARPKPTRISVAQARPAWEAISRGRAGGEVEGEVEGGAWADAGQELRVPEEKNNHYFVRGMDEFRFDHL